MTPWYYSCQHIPCGTTTGDRGAAQRECCFHQHPRNPLILHSISVALVLLAGGWNFAAPQYGHVACPWNHRTLVWLCHALYSNRLYHCHWTVYCSHIHKCEGSWAVGDCSYDLKILMHKLRIPFKANFYPSPKLPNSHSKIMTPHPPF